MGSCMTFQMRLYYKYFLAEIALVWFFTSVRFHMVIQTSLSLKYGFFRGT